jgi:tripartite ATP-independent transporter DctP family solute receptor
MEEIMKFKRYCTHLAMGLAIGLATAMGATAQDYKYKWKLATTETPDYYMTQLSQKFIDKVTQRTGGKVTGEVFASGQLGNLIGALEGLNMGNIDIVMDGVSSLSEANKLFNVFGIAYLYDNKEHQYRFWDKYFKKVTDYIARESGYRLVAVIDGMNRQLSPRKPIRSLADVKNLKIRVPTITPYVRVWQLLGAAPVTMSLSEVYTALQTGVVEAQENDIPLTLSMGFYEVAPFCVLTNHVPYEGALYFDERTFQSYPDELKKIIYEVGAEISAESREIYKTLMSDSIKKLKEKNVEIIELDLTEFKKAAASMRDEYSYAKSILNYIDKAKNP